MAGRMIQIQGLWWPDDVQSKWVHAFKHVRSLEFAIAVCRQHRTAVQAGGNVGLWPRRMAESFARVITFEPDTISRECLAVNVPASVEVRPEALGERSDRAGLYRESLGSHRVVPGASVEIIALDSLRLTDVDLIQLDIEGYEFHALAGAVETIDRCRPVIQVELRGFTKQYGHSDTDVREFLTAAGYRQVSAQPGNDFVFVSHDRH